MFGQFLRCAAKKKFPKQPLYQFCYYVNSIFTVCVIVCVCVLFLWLGGKYSGLVDRRSQPRKPGVFFLFLIPFSIFFCQFFMFYVGGIIQFDQSQCLNSSQESRLVHNMTQGRVAQHSPIVNMLQCNTMQGQTKHLSLRKRDAMQDARPYVIS